MNERKVYTREFKLHAASMVLDDNCPVPDVCASLDIGPTALRRWVDQVRKEREGQPVKGTKAITEDQRQIQELKARKAIQTPPCPLKMRLGLASARLFSHFAKGAKSSVLKRPISTAW
ncbi:transposase [Pseudomonas veronii]